MQAVITFMNQLQKLSGNRLKNIREIFNEGSKLSANQFAFLLDESADRIRNCELGRTSISIDILKKLYERGINPSYIITGEGDIFTDTPTGKELRNKILAKANVIDHKLIDKIIEYKKVSNG
ncbi:helix-turn-helix transcriptional regulator [Candidatus Kapabacteria bacterium]|nr:helix-turn-helix transcriptional regulator [Candidatus Kapabacteria bacterium]